ncbi:hypothetical protein HDZ31DRAFT_28473 [Schizophyllum fasciatum]
MQQPPSSSQPAAAQGSLAAPDAVQPSASQDTAFTPRKEFIRSPKPIPNVFSLLAVSASNCIRLYSFPLSFIVALRRLLEQQTSITEYREDVQNSMCEFVLEGKPWANPKSVAAERLLVHILAAIYQQGYAFLSVIDYGREADDRLVMAFSKPSSTPASQTGSPRPSQDAPTLSSHSARERRVPFALSFASATCMRVIAPPLHCTPAILQAVRGSWPRGVVSEKKVSDDCFEFKLKGYRWFQEDTFATDSLRHILSLLSALDANSFSLLASLSLTNRSRVKDLWVFTGPPSPSAIYTDSANASMLGSHLDMRRAPDQSYQSLPMHHRMATEPMVSPLPHPAHHRAATEAAPRRTLSKNRRPNTPPHDGAPLGNETSPKTLRKPAPRAQVPVSVASITDVEDEGFRAQLPSTVPSGVENMTGIGAGPPHSGGLLPPQVAMPMPQAEPTPDVFYTASPFTAGPPPQPSPVRSSHEQPSVPAPVRAPSDEVPVQTIEELSAGSLTPPCNGMPGTQVSTPGTQAGTPPLLPSGVFRDSAFSSNTEESAEVPIKWTGLAARLQEGESRTGVNERVRSDPDPPLPGAWQPTPVEEKPAELRPDSGVGREESPAREVQEVSGRIASPELTQPDVVRKSEAGLIEQASRRQTAQAAESGALAQPSEGLSASPTARPGAPKTRSGHTSVRGWVLVNVEPVSPRSEASKELGKATKGKENEIRDTKDAGKEKGSVASLKGKGRDTDSASSTRSSPSSAKHKREGSGARRFFSLTRRGSKSVSRRRSAALPFSALLTRGLKKSEDAAKSKTSFRDRLRSVGAEKVEDRNGA